MRFSCSSGWLESMTNARFRDWSMSKNLPVWQQETASNNISSSYITCLSLSAQRSPVDGSLFCCDKVVVKALGI